MFRNLTPPSEQRELWVKLPALEKMSACTVMWALSFRSHMCHFLALNVMSHIPDSSHHPKKCVLSRIDVPYLWTQPSLLYMLLETGIEPGSCCESHSHCLHGPFSQQGHAGTWRRRMPGSRLASSYWKSIWPRHFTWLLQFLSSLPMFQSDKPTSSDALQNACYIIGSKCIYLYINIYMGYSIILYVYNYVLQLSMVYDYIFCVCIYTYICIYMNIYNVWYIL